MEVAEETASRPVRPCRCVVAEVPKTAKANDFAHITPGTVTAFVAQEGEPLLNKLIETIEANNSKEFNTAIDQIKRMATEDFIKGAISQISPESKPRTLPSFAEISYANKTLVTHIHVNEVLRVNVHPFPYNGGQLDGNKFSMTEYYRADSKTPLTCVLLIRTPKLSKIEREALRLVPSGSPNNIGPSVVAPLTPALLEAVLVATPYAAQWLVNEFVNFFVNFLHGPVIVASIPDAVLKSKDFQRKLKSLPPEVTAAELLRLRTDLLLQKTPK